MTDLANRREPIGPNPLRPVSHRRVQVPAVKGVVGEAGVVARVIAPTRVHPFGVVEAGPSPFVLIPGRSVMVENAVRPGVGARLVIGRVPRRRDCPEETIGFIRDRNGDSQSPLDRLFEVTDRFAG
jgi:hypothetical protein